MAFAARTLHIEAGTYDLVQEEARRRHRDPDALADQLLREQLGGRRGDLEEMRGTLTELANLRARQTDTVDAVALVREGREELERRSDCR